MNYATQMLRNVIEKEADPKEANDVMHVDVLLSMTSRSASLNRSQLSIGSGNTLASPPPQIRNGSEFFSLNNFTAGLHVKDHLFRQK